MKYIIVILAIAILCLGVWKRQLLLKHVQAIILTVPLAVFPFLIWERMGIQRLLWSVEDNYYIGIPLHEYAFTFMLSLFVVMTYIVTTQNHAKIAAKSMKLCKTTVIVFAVLFMALSFIPNGGTFTSIAFKTTSITLFLLILVSPQLAEQRSVWHALLGIVGVVSLLHVLQTFSGYIFYNAGQTLGLALLGTPLEVVFLSMTFVILHIITFSLFEEAFS